MWWKFNPVLELSLLPMLNVGFILRGSKSMHPWLPICILHLGMGHRYSHGEYAMVVVVKETFVVDMDGFQVH